MNKRLLTVFYSFLLLVLSCFIFSCKKEHLLPPIPPGNSEPLIYISASQDNDSVYFAGGVNDYSGGVSVFDTLHFRTFNFTLKNSAHPAQSYFEISINNYKNVQGDLQDDLDSTIHSGTLDYQDSVHFIPLAATVIWVDSAGVKFSSDLFHQTHLFSITSVEDITFENRNYKKLTLEFACNIIDNHGHTLHLTNGNATILLGIN